jgi:hypothetical protein
MTGRGIVKFIVLNGLYIDFKAVRDEWTEAALPSANTWKQLEELLWIHNTETKMREGGIRALMEAGQSVPNGDHEWQEFTRLYKHQNLLYEIARRDRERRRELERFARDTGCPASQFLKSPVRDIIEGQKSVNGIFIAPSDIDDLGRLMAVMLLFVAAAMMP